MVITVCDLIEKFECAGKFTLCGNNVTRKYWLIEDRLKKAKKIGPFSPLVPANTPVYPGQPCLSSRIHNLLKILIVIDRRWYYINIIFQKSKDNNIKSGKLISLVWGILGNKTSYNLLH